MRWTAVFAALCAAPLLLGAASASAKDDLVIGVAQFPSSLHPDIDAEVVKFYVDEFAVRPITTYDPSWKNTCLLCTELPTIQNGLAKIETLPNGQKGMAVTLKLNPNLKWGDGEPVTAKDVAFTVKVAQDPNSGFSNVHPWTRVRSVQIVDDHTVILHLNSVDTSYNEWDEILPEHIEGPIYANAKKPGDYINNTAYNRAPTTAGLWDGPYMITSYTEGSQIILSPNPYWSGTKPGFKHIVIRYIGDTAALQANLLSGDIDMVAGEGIGLTIDQAIALQQQHPNQFSYNFKPSLTYEHIDIQKNNPLFQDVRVRQAMLLALDRKTLVQKLFNGLQPVANSWVNPLDPNYSSAVPTYAYDPKKAKALMAEAGWKPGPDGICRDAKGDRFSFVIGTTAGNRLRELTEQVLQSQWKASCMEAVIKNEPARTFFGETVKERKYPGLSMYAWSSDVNESPERTLGSDQIPTEANGWGGANYIAFDNKQMDADIKAASSELDPAKAKVIWADMQKIYATQLPVLPLFFRADAHVFPKWLKGYTPTGQADMSPLWAENWHQG
jgi:peptide/nickel transport system substrate-binding protein